MRIYAPYMERQAAARKQERDNMILDRTSAILSLLLLVGMIGLLCHACVDAVVKTAENEEEYKRPIYVEQSYERPAAYRVATPTMRQMDHLHGLLSVMAVNDAK